MGDSESLLLVLLILYLVECLVWVPRGAVVLGSWRGNSFQWRSPGRLLGNLRGGWHLAAPIPPLGLVFRCQQLPFSVSPDALFAYNALCLEAEDRLRHSGRWWPWEKVRHITTRNRLIQINGLHFCQAISPGAARFLAAWLKTIRDCPAAARPRAIREFLQAMFSPEKIRARWALFRARSRGIRIACQVAFFYLFVAFPWLLIRYGWLHVGWWLLGGLLLQTTVIALLFRRSFRILYPQADEEGFKRVLTMFLAPPAALRAADHLGRPLLEEFHLLGVAHLLLPPHQFTPLARRFLADAHFPMLPVCPHPAPEAVAAEHWFRKEVQSFLEAFLGQCGYPRETLLSSPRKIEAGSRSYCPRCGSQFTKDQGACLDCGGYALEPFLASTHLSRQRGAT